MVLLRVVCLVAILPGIVGQIDPSAPDCAINCWENTKYVSKCSTDVGCLCSEPDYTNSVYQCLFSQCDTVHFGSALHHVIAQCFGSGNEILFAVPPIPNRDDLRRREAEYAAGAILYGSGSEAGFPTESVDYPIQSANYPTQSVGGPYSPSPTVPHFPLETATSPALTSATPTPAPYSALAETTTASPVLYTGSSSSMTSSTGLALLFALLVIILTY
ncbi:uncharacterized protein LY89DRAFT_363312 [Mollisia scopiformis]|uniref:CFEM domain-containing protein n=1 Tax=Mollisia scopiformis TaxID=149040 RepID=A0A132B4J6_MOLSC|nr:uncharacterized protein LY89DRAFT_363312 [Mollisia scopiformis]KUJ07322.1 hypothetical protein LY89DRAFT_363312 [Mollisia scopiformis]